MSCAKKKVTARAFRVDLALREELVVYELERKHAAMCSKRRSKMRKTHIIMKRN